MRSSANAWAVIVAAGKGERFGSDQPKQFTPVCGKPLVVWAIEPFMHHPEIRGVSLVVPPEVAAEPPEWMARLADAGVTIVAGGAERTDSVRLGLATVPSDVEFVAVHDGARPLIAEDGISRVLAGAGRRHGAVAGRRVTDSLKESDAEGRVLRAVSRERLWRAETPQVFPPGLLIDVHREAEAEGVCESDCAALCERYGVEVVMIEIAEANPKVTRAEDVDLIAALLERRKRGQSA
ncbi:MAG: 2-C-methyl-D-erythritol 4-phosphate cytidylyltransferase [Planctomycetota bacterium]|jgi:2-C-methyl-D-erythritol 4-phosphate cytidylyltransferase